MEERLIIKDFGPIKEVNMTFGRFNVLIGEQATGKSAVLKVLAVCRYFSYLTGKVVESANPFSAGLLDWGILNFRGQDSYIEYDCEDYTLYYEIVSETSSGGFTLKGPGLYGLRVTAKTRRFKELQEELQSLRKEGSIPYTFFKTSVAEVMRNPLFLSTERNSHFLGFTTSNNKAILENAGKLRQLRQRYYQEVEIEPLNLSYKNNGTEMVIKRTDEDAYHRLSESASGYQSAVPIVLSIKAYTEPPEAEGLPLSKQKTFIIEEPELNLFPTAQYELMKFLVDKTMNYGNQMFLATHSPYILTALNDMILAAQAGVTDAEKTNSVIEEKYWLNSYEVRAYKLQNGTCQNILDSETGLIHAEEIDEVSNRINAIYDNLCEIKYAE